MKRLKVKGVITPKSIIIRTSQQERILYIIMDQRGDLGLYIITTTTIDTNTLSLTTTIINTNTLSITELIIFFFYHLYRSIIWLYLSVRIKTTVTNVFGQGQSVHPELEPTCTLRQIFVFFTVREGSLILN